MATRIGRHRPHLLVSGPWDAPSVELNDLQQHHLLKVLRLRSGSPVTYTDGAGILGSGLLEDRSLVRGDEHQVARPLPSVALAVAPPKSTERARFLVEKLAELGVDRLIWLRTRHGEGRPPRPEKARSWAQGALEQSRGAWLMELTSLTPPDGLGDSTTLWVGTLGGPLPQRVVADAMILIGPEAGLVEEEVPVDARPLGLGKQVLRIETAAIAAATLILDRSGRLEP